MTTRQMEQTGEFFMDSLYQPNFEGYNGTWGGYFSRGLYSFDQPYEIRPQLTYPQTLHTEVGPTPPMPQPPENVDDGGYTALLLTAAMIAIKALSQ